MNEYAAACGGDTSDRTIGDRRMDAVVAVERAARAAEAKRDATLALLREARSWLDEPDLASGSVDELRARIDAFLEGK